MEASMRSAVFSGKGQIEIVERNIPSLQPDEVLIRVDFCALCGSDKRLLEHGSSVTPGHEIAGTVVEAGSDAARSLLEDFIIVYIPIYCGICRNCKSGYTNRCENLKDLVGWQRDGGFQQYVAVPAGNVISVPRDIERIEAVLALDTIGTAAHGIRSSIRYLGSTPQRTAVIGCGPLGLGAAIVAEHLGSKQVRVDDVQDKRVEAAKGLGFERIEESGQTFDLVIEASGSPHARNRALDLVHQGGVVLLLGEGEQPWVVPATPQWRRLEAAYIRSFYFPLSEVGENWPILRKSAGRLKALIDDVRPLDDLGKIFKDFMQGESVKPVVAV